MAVAYISIGGNLGNRLEFLQQGLNSCAQHIGSVQAISTVFETPAVGFDGHPFLNACFSIATQLTAPQLMEQLLTIEKEHGRTRNNSENYQNRTLDLDLLFFDDLVLQNSNLIVPHPKLTERRFVLQPLAEIAANKAHPEVQKTVQALLDSCQDKTSLAETAQPLLHPMFTKLSNYDFICVEGIIGCGKTTLANILAQTMGYKTLNERFADNPFLPKFYREPERYAFPLELSFLADRFKQINEESEQLDLFQSGVIADYHISKSLVFAKNTLSEDEYPLFNQLYEIMSRSANQPGLCIYLRQTPKRAKANIKNRGRSYEQNIELNYLEKLANGYDKHLPYLKNQMVVAEVDVSGLDFVLNNEDLEALLYQVNLQLDANV